MECSIILFQTRSVHAFIFSEHDHGWKNKPEETGINSIVLASVNRVGTFRNDQILSFFWGREQQGDKFYHLCLNSVADPSLQLQHKFPCFK